MNKKTIITLADSTYFPLLEELVNSIRKFKESADTDICVLDAGLNSSQIEKISSSVISESIVSSKFSVEEN